MERKCDERSKQVLVQSTKYRVALRWLAEGRNIKIDYCWVATEIGSEWNNDEPCWVREFRNGDIEDVMEIPARYIWNGVYDYNDGKRCMLHSATVCHENPAAYTWSTGNYSFKTEADLNAFLAEVAGEEEKWDIQKIR